MRGLKLAAILLSGLNLASSQLSAFEAAGQGITLDDVGTLINDIQTIFNHETFNVNADVTFAFLEEEFTNSSFSLKWRTFVDNMLIDEGEEDLQNLKLIYDNHVQSENSTADSTLFNPAEVTESLYVGSGTVSGSGSHDIRVEFDLDGSVSTVERSYQSYDPGVSFIPLLVILILAMTTQMVEFSLGFGVFVGACMITGSFKEGFKSTLDTYVLGALADTDHGYVYLFTLFMAGFVGILEKSGGIIGFANMMSTFAKSTRSGQLCSYVTGLVLFFDDYANILVAGPCLMPVQDSVMTSREKLAFVVDATAAPIASLTPVSSWVGFEVGLIQAELDKIEAIIKTTPTVGDSGFGVFLQTIRYRYYPIFMLFLIPMLILTQRDFGPMLVAERKVRVYGRKDGGDGRVEDVPDGLNKNKPESDTPVHWVNMIVPVVLLVFYIFYLLIRTGLDGTGEQSFLDIMQSADSYSALLWGTMAAALTTTLYFMLQFKKDGNFAMPKPGSFVPSFIYEKCMKNDDDELPKQLMGWRQAMESFLSGMENVFAALIVLTLAWSSGAIMTAVGLDRFFSQLIVQSNLDPRILPTISFVVSLFMAFATGTSWGTMTIMFPLLMVPTYIASNGDPIIFYATTAGILSGAVAGDHASPISDTTVLSSMASRCQLIEHVKTQAPYVAIITMWSILVGTIPVGYEAYPNGVGVLLGAVCVVLVTFALGRPVISKTGAFGPMTELFMRFDQESELHKLKQDTIRAFENGGPIDMPENKAKALEDDGDSQEKPQSADTSEDVPKIEEVETGMKATAD